MSYICTYYIHVSEIVRAANIVFTLSREPRELLLHNSAGITAIEHPARYQNQSFNDYTCRPFGVVCLFILSAAK